MHNRRFYVFIVVFLGLGLLSGCKSLTPVEATKSAGDKTRMLISEHVADEARARKLITLVDQLETDLMTFVDSRASHNEALRQKNADYDATPAELEGYINKLMIAQKEGQEYILDTRSAMKNLMTRNEWAEVFSFKEM